MPLPVFVIGRNRSGTTWLANQLCEHPKVAGVQHERHHGIHESAYFDWIDGRYGDLSQRINYAEFVEAMAASDFFHLAGADRDFLYSLWPVTYEEVFRSVMDRFAERQGAKAWIEKADVRESALGRAEAAYPDARFVGIIRDVVPNTASNLRMPGAPECIKGRKCVIFRMTLAWVYTTKILNAFSKRSDRVFLVHFEDMKSDLEDTMRRICEFLGLQWDPQILGQTYRPNTSFKTKADRRKALTAGERAMIRVVAAVGRLIPKFVLGLADRFRRWWNGRPTLPRWFYRLQPFFQDDERQYDDLMAPSSQPPGEDFQKP